jgi:hypothetical protein
MKMTNWKSIVRGNMNNKIHSSKPQKLLRYKIIPGQRLKIIRRESLGKLFRKGFTGFRHDGNATEPAVENPR